jgi:hypothetical protein
MTGQQSAPAESAGAAITGAGASMIVGTRVDAATDSHPPADYRQATTVWARAQIRAFGGPGPIPEYGTADWLRLPERDPRRYAAVIIAAEQARESRSPSDRAAQRQTPPARPRPLQAAPGWPPVAIPGCPGAYLTPEAA